MAPRFDCELGGVTANSYICIEIADDIASNLAGGEAWRAKDLEEKVISLMEATRWLETLDYRGDRCSPSQRLKWPRLGAECDGVTSDCASIPYAIQEAEVVLAIKYSDSPSSFPGVGGGNTAPTGTYVKRQKLDVLEIEYDEFSNPESSSCDSCGDPSIIQSFPWLRDLLGCWVTGIATGDNKMIRLYRN